MSMATLERALIDLGQEIDYPATPDLVAMVVSELRSEVPAPVERRAPWFVRARPALAVAATLLAIGGVVLGVSPDAREAVADFLGIGGVRIQVQESPLETPAAGEDIFFGDPLSLQEAQAELSFDILLPGSDGLGEPDAVYLDRSIAQGMVSLVYAERPGFPAADETGVALLINEFQGSTHNDLMKKLVGAGTSVDFVDVDGELAYWVEGQHSLNVIDAEGRIFQDRSRLAGNTLLFQQGTVTIRIEGPLSQDEAIAIAESLK